MRRAFTLIEIVLVIGILAFLLFLVLFITTSAIGRGALQGAENILVQSLRRAQTLSQQNVDGAVWGVYICPGQPVPVECGVGSYSSVILFRRTTQNRFGTFDTANDQVFEINNRIIFSGTLYTTMQENAVGGGKKGLAFTKLAGEPACDGSACSGTIISTVDNGQRQITVSTKGVIEH